MKVEGEDRFQGQQGSTIQTVLKKYDHRTAFRLNFGETNRVQRMTGGPKFAQSVGLSAGIGLCRRSVDVEPYNSVWDEQKGEEKIAVGRSFSGSDRKYSATSFAWTYRTSRLRCYDSPIRTQRLTSPYAARGGSLGRPVGLVLGKIPSGICIDI